MLTQRMQIQAIADRLAGLPQSRTIRPRELREPWRTCYQAICEGDTSATRESILRARIQTLPNWESALGAILAAVPGDARRTLFPSLAELAADLLPVQWLWQSWIPKGMISLLGAVPGAGKSFVALDLARRIIGGTTWPDGTPIDGAAPVLYVDAEAIPQVLNERASAWEMDRRLLFLMLPDDDGILDFGLEMYRDQLIEAVHHIQPALIIVDSLSTISSKGENAVDDVRTILSFFNILAQDSNCGLLLIHHLRKHMPLPTVPDLTIDDFRGSSHIIAMSRSVMGLSVVKTGPEIDRNGPRKLEIVKTNLAQYPDSLGVEFAPLHPKGVILRWKNEAPKPYAEPSRGELCGDWLLGFLQEKGEPVRVDSVVDAADEAGYSRATLYRARKQLQGQIVNTQGRRHPDNAWALASWGGAAAADSEDEADD